MHACKREENIGSKSIRNAYLSTHQTRRLYRIFKKICQHLEIINEKHLQLIRELLIRIVSMLTRMTQKKD